jgi:hypothetical protein
VRNISSDENDDLFWAIRGGGGNFGVVTEFEFQLYPFDRNVLSGNIVWPIEQARDVLEFYAEWSPGLSDDLYTGPMLATSPDGVGMVIVEALYAGDPSLGEKEMAPLRALGTPMDDGISMQDYTVMQTQEDAAWAHGVRSYAKNGMVKEWSQDLVDTMIEAYVPDPRFAMFTHTAGGAVNRVADVDTAFPHRNAETMLSVGGLWADPAIDNESMALGRDWFSKLAPFTGGYYDNIESSPESVASNYGPAHERLAKLKGQYDAGNLFRLNSNIKPA